MGRDSGKINTTVANLLFHMKSKCFLLSTHPYIPHVQPLHLLCRSFSLLICRLPQFLSFNNADSCTPVGALTRRLSCHLLHNRRSASTLLLIMLLYYYITNFHEVAIFIESVVYVFLVSLWVSTTYPDFLELMSLNWFPLISSLNMATNLCLYCQFSYFPKLITLSYSFTCFLGYVS